MRNYDAEVEYLMAVYNELTGRRVREGRGLKARLKESTLDECERMLRHRYSIWNGTNMYKYFVPMTLFRPCHYQTYCAEANEAHKAARLVNVVIRDPYEKDGPRTIRFDIERALSFENYEDEK